jgi:hypothetical protein
MTTVAPQNPFEYVANPTAANRSLTPRAVEQQVGWYLERLSTALARQTHDPNGAAHALVFGEWGHGKSQVVYRADDHLRSRCTEVWAIRVVPERLTPGEVLAAAADRADPATADRLRQARAEAGEGGEDTDRAGEVAATALARVARDQKIAHTVLLLDEAATMGDSFQHFLGELLTRFDDAGRNLHIVQCHSLASLDRSLQIARALGDRFQTASTIFLPSIRLDQAYEFFRNRLTETPGYEHRADGANALISPGVAATLCDAAGGHPRRMLQYARRLHDATGGGQAVPPFSGQLVLDVFATEPGLDRNSRLYRPEMLRRVCDLLEQLRPPHWQPLRDFLRAEMPALFGESRHYTAAELAHRLGIALTQLGAATREFDGIPLLTARTDDDATSYGLSVEFRQRLSDAFGYSGDMPLRQAQHRVLLSPVRCQPEVADGLRAVSQNGLSQEEAPTELGRADGISLRGYRVDVNLSGASQTIPVLVTGFIGETIPAELVRAVVAGLVARPRQWLRAFIFLQTRRESWDQWRASDTGQEVLAPLGEGVDRLCVFEEAVWGELQTALDDPFGEANRSGVRGARFFAALYHARLAYQEPGGAGEQNERVYAGIRGLITRHLPTLADVIYLPTPAEIDLLRWPNWGRPGQRQRFNLRELREAGGGNYTGTALDRLTPTYLTRDGGRYRRTDPGEGRLHQAALTVLQRAESPPTLDEVATAVEAENLFVWPAGTGGLGNRIRQVVGWVLEEWRELGSAREEGGRFEFVNLEAEVGRARTRMRRRLREVRQGLDAVRRFGWHLQDPGTPAADAFALAEADYRELSGAVPGETGLLVEQDRLLRELAVRVGSLEDQVRGLREQANAQREQVLGDLARRRERLTRLLAGLPEGWSGLVVPPSELEQWDGEVLRLREPAASDSESPPTFAELSDGAGARRAVLDAWLELFAQDAPAPADPRRRLLASIARGMAFREIRVTVEEVVDEPAVV